MTETEKWNRLKNQLQTMKFAEVEQNQLRQFEFIPLPNGFVRVLFLGTHVAKYSQSTDLNYVDIDPLYRSHDLTNWNTLLPPHEADDEKTDLTQLLLNERQRLSSTKGVTSYSVAANRILFSSNSLYQFSDMNPDTKRMNRTSIPKAENRPIIDPKISPDNQNICAYYSQNDLYVQDLTKDADSVLRITHESSAKKFAGFPSFCILEEFDRYTGYYWLKTNDPTKGKIVYEVVDESSVNEYVTVSPKSMATRLYKKSGHPKMLVGRNRHDLAPWSDATYPSAGSTNPEVELRYAEIDFETGSVSNYKLVTALSKQIPWVEYIVNYGWLGQSGIWAYVVNRIQDKAAILYIPLEAFSKLENSEIPPDSTKPDQPMETNQIKPIQMLHYWTSPYWVSATQSFYFFEPTSDNEVDFIFSMSAPNQHDHLFYFKSKFCNFSTSELVEADTLIQPITSGDFNVSLNGIDVDEQNKIIYFQGNADTPLENHLYSVSYDCPNSGITRLTREGFDHSKIRVSIQAKLFISTYSNVQTPPTCEVYRLTQNRHGLAFLMSSSMSSTSSSISVSKKSKISADGQKSTAELFSFKNQNGDDIYGFLYRPDNFDPTKTYPTICYVYGGPSVQVVRNTFELPRTKRHKMYSKLGYAVVAFDNRGSAGRSLYFQGQIKGQLGEVEVSDQIAGIDFVSREFGVIDTKRIAIEGWSYGGFMSLMALAKRSDVFKIAISGAPVTDWRLYDTAYTERYLGLPKENSDGYDKSSVLSYVEGIPDEPNRLLIFHGMIDENVLLYHTTELIDALTMKQKPYDFKPLIQERHGLRSSSSISYYEMIVLNYLERNL